jgi:hypothetical protein
MKRSLLVILLTCVVSYAQVKSVAERLGYPPNSKLLIILADDTGGYFRHGDADLAMADGSGGIRQATS